MYQERTAYPYTQKTAHFRAMRAKSGISQLFHTDEASEYLSKTLNITHKRKYNFITIGKGHHPQLLLDPGRKCS